MYLSYDSSNKRQQISFHKKLFSSCLIMFRRVVTLNSTKFSQFHQSQHRPCWHKKKQKIIRTTIKDFYRKNKFFTKHKSTALNFHRVWNVNILYSKWHNGFCTMTLPNYIKICPKNPKVKTVFKFKTFTFDHNTACLINQFALFKWKSQVNIKHNLVVIWFRRHLFYCNDYYNLFNRF